MAALSGDAARQPEAVRAAFAAGIENQLALLSPEGAASDGADRGRARARCLAILAQAVGAIVLSRACPDDSPLADEILAVCRDEILASLGEAQAASAPSGDRPASKTAQQAVPRKRRESRRTLSTGTVKNSK
jgi:TetR/AcrR family transcriptional repressor of nem operon